MKKSKRNKVITRKYSSCAIIPVWNNREILWVLERFESRYVDTVLVVMDEADKNYYNLVRERGDSIAPMLHIIRNPERKGIGYAIRQGIDYCIRNDYDIIVVMAGNGKDDPHDIPKLIKKIEEGYDYVQGSRFIKGGISKGLPLQREIFNRFWPYFWRIITGKKISEVTNGFRAYKTSIFSNPEIDIYQSWLDGYALEYYIHYCVLTKGYRFTEVPVSKIYRNKKDYTRINPLRDWPQIILPPILLKLGFKK